RGQEQRPMKPILARSTAKRKRLSLLLAAIFVLAQSSGLVPGTARPPSAHASTINVTSTGDSGPGTLRDAIFNSTVGETINITVPGAITLTSGVLGIGQNLTINGLGPNLTIIDGNMSSRVFQTFVGALSPGVFTVNISGMTIRHGAGVPGGG